MSVTADSTIANTLFPPPPPFYAHFTQENLDQLAHLRAAGSSPPHSTDNELAELAAKLDPPKADWVDQEGRWMCFGEILQVRHLQGCS